MAADAGYRQTRFGCQAETQGLFGTEGGRPSMEGEPAPGQDSPGARPERWRMRAEMVDATGTMAVVRDSCPSRSPGAEMIRSGLFTFGIIAAAFGANPIITTMYTADPSAHVWADGKVWLYPSHDRDDAQWWDMTDWHVFSSDDLVNWTDHGVCLPLNDIPFAKSSAWAPDCIYRDGTYYFYFPVSSVEWHSNTDRIGVATSTAPQGPFTVVATPLVTGPAAFDPCVFIDDDGQA